MQIYIDQQKDIVESLLDSKIMITTYDDWKTDSYNAYNKLIDQFKTKSLKGFGLEEGSLSVIAASACIYYIEDNYFGKTAHVNSITKIKNYYCY